MSLKKIHDKQPESFEFSKINIKLVEDIIKKYPEDRKKSAVMPLLYLAQRQNNNWIPLAAMKHIAKFLEIPYIKVYEIATFYTMYNLAPVGKYFIQVCTTSPCLLRGAGEIVKLCQKKISNTQKEISDYKKTLPLNRFGKPSDIANAVLFFASNKSDWITGAYLIVDGGDSAS